MDAASIKTDRLYGDLACLWPLVSPPEDYAEEARRWRDVLRRKLGPGRHSLLELGVGGGHNLSHLTADFEATAVDLSANMLDLSKRLNPGVEHHVGDMRTVRLGRKFKAVLIHDAISYMRTEVDLRATFDTAVAHLEAGGVFITLPDRFRETFHDPCVDFSTRSDRRTELTFVEYTYDPDPTDTTVETIMFYLIREDGRLRIEQDRHITGLFCRRRWLDLMEQAGFQVEQCPCGPEDSPQSPVLLVGTLSPSAEPV